jgi:hypothetical protein
MRKLFVILIAHFSLTALGHPGVGIVMDTKGNLFYTDLTHIWKIDRQGKKTIAVNNVHSHEIYIDSLDNLYGEHLWYNGEAKDTWSHYVWKLSVNGKIEKIIPDTEGFLTNYSFVRDHMGHMFWADRDNKDCQKVVRKNTNGTLRKIGDQCLSNIGWMTSTTNGTIYLVDQQQLKKVDQLGHVITLTSDLIDDKLQLSNKDHYLSGVSTDKDENIYVADCTEHAVKKVTQQGKVSLAFKTTVPWAPSGILVAPNGDAWLLEYSTTNTVRVERITKEGQRIIY